MDSLRLKCVHCGGVQFALPKDPQPSDVVTCASCRASERYDLLQQQALAEGKRAIGEMFRDAFKK